MKASGIGRINGAPGLDAYSELKIVILYKNKDVARTPAAEEKN